MSARPSRKARVAARPEPADRGLLASPCSAQARCAICGKPIAHPARPPFCSERCRLLDLGRWLDGSYRLPVTEREAHAGEPSELGPQEHSCDD